MRNDIDTDIDIAVHPIVQRRIDRLTSENERLKEERTRYRGAAIAALQLYHDEHRGGSAFGLGDPTLPHPD